MKPSFGSYIRTKRLEAGYTLRKFAEAIDISPTFLSRMERDEIDPPGEGKITAMAKALSIDPEELTLMAGRVPAKVKEMILQRPELIPVLRTANSKSDYDLQQLIDFAIHRKTEESK